MSFSNFDMKMPDKTTDKGLPIAQPSICLINGARSGGSLERGAVMENGVGARSANVKIRWSAERRLRQLCPERGALQRGKWAGARSGKRKYCKIRSADS